ncbi:MAG: hypothetical protein GX036_01075 [Firmicutes bacterium]|nr:hypothetical protein [Bacillota bacterium]
MKRGLGLKVCPGKRRGTGDSPGSFLGVYRGLMEVLYDFIGGFMKENNGLWKILLGEILIPMERYP